VNNQLIFTALFGRPETRSFIVVARLNFEGVFPYTGASGASAESWRPKIAASIEKYRLT
jgi:hypothetical protein